MQEGNCKHRLSHFRNHHRKDKARNIAPNLVEHVDWLLGGSVANAQRVTQLRSALWPDQELVEQLAAEIQNHTGD